MVQIGACDGLMDDPLYQWITRYRRSGILLEPQREMFERLNADCRNIRFENVVIADTDCVRPLYKLRQEAIERDWQKGQGVSSG